jgi:hypothetical protein
VAQGGDWGNAVTEQMSLLGAPELIGIHTNMPATVPNDINTAAFAGAPAPSGLSADEQRAYEQLALFYKHGLGSARVDPDVGRLRQADQSGRPVHPRRGQTLLSGRAQPAHAS